MTIVSPMDHLTTSRKSLPSYHEEHDYGDQSYQRREHEAVGDGLVYLFESQEHTPW
jgi:hypothetical protein